MERKMSGIFTALAFVFLSSSSVAQEVDESAIQTNQNTIDEIQKMVNGQPELAGLKADADKLQVALDDFKATPTVEKGLLFDKMVKDLQFKLNAAASSSDE